jgi:hypothetical protein
LRQLTVCAFLLACIASPARPSGSISGRIQADGARVSHADVVVVGLHLRVQADQYGSYRFPSVPAGRHVLQVHSAGYAAVIESTEVLDGRHTSLDFELTAGDAFEVRGLRPKDPAPPADWRPPVPPDSALLERMRRADDILLVRLTGMQVDHPYKQYSTYDDYGIIWTRKLKDRSLRSRLVDLLSLPESYDNGKGWSVKKCIASPGVAIRFLDRVGEIDVMLCTGCGYVWVTAGEEHLGGDIDLKKAEFKAWLKDAIPDDPAIQALREH